MAWDLIARSTVVLLCISILYLIACDWARLCMCFFWFGLKAINKGEKNCNSFDKAICSGIIVFVDNGVKTTRTTTTTTISAAASTQQYHCLMMAHIQFQLLCIEWNGMAWYIIKEITCTRRNKCELKKIVQAECISLLLDIFFLFRLVE